MSVPGARPYRETWIARACELNKRGHFQHYSSSQKAEVLRKGYLGLVAPDLALKIAAEKVRLGSYYQKPAFTCDLRDLGIAGEDEVRSSLLRLLAEIPPETYCPPVELCKPPGYPFVFESQFFGELLYFKFQVHGDSKRQQVMFWSCHPPRFGG